jgi:hypothetical protein
MGQKVIVIRIIIIFLLFNFIKQGYAADKKNGLIESYSEQTRLYRKLIRENAFKYQYKQGDKLKYKVQIKTWTRKYIDVGLRAFHFNTFNLILEEQIGKVNDESIELIVKVDYKNIKEPLFWGPSISIDELKGSVLVNLCSHNWIPEISNIDINSYNDFKKVEFILKRIIAQIHIPIFFSNWDPNPPSNLIKGIKAYSWGDEGKFIAEIYSVIRNFENVGDSLCAIIDNIGEIDLNGGKKGVFFGIVYFDYVNGRVKKLDYSGSEKLCYKDAKVSSSDILYTMLNVEMVK